MLRQQMRRGIEPGAMVRLCSEHIIRNEVESHTSIVFTPEHLEDAGLELKVLDVEYNNYGFDPEILLENFKYYPEGALRVVERPDKRHDTHQTPSLFDQNGDPIDVDRTPTVDTTNRPGNEESPDGLPITPK